MKLGSLAIALAALLLLGTAAMRHEQYENSSGYGPASQESYIVPYMDVRWQDMTDEKPTRIAEMLPTFWFNKTTKWPTGMLVDPEAVLQQAMNPGLGVRALHRQGIVGTGVSVAIIDQGICGSHPEFSERLVKYAEFPEPVGESSMHGPAVASLLVGQNCGTAPGANLYFAACPTRVDSNGTISTEPMAQALWWFIDLNGELPSAERIRVVSISAAPGSEDNPFFRNKEAYRTAVRAAEAAGILVLDCAGEIAPSYLDASTPDDITKAGPGWPDTPKADVATERQSKWLLAPCSPRTSAEIYTEDSPSYQYTGKGGLSWGIPWTAGVLAMGWQIWPEMTKELAMDLLWKSAYKRDGFNFIDPQAFIALVKEQVAGR